MIAVDTNILVYAHREESPFHESAKRSILELIGMGMPWAIAWPCVHEFLAIVTSPKIYRPPSTWRDGCLFLDGIEGTGTMRWLGEGPGYWPLLKALGEAKKSVGGQVHDTRIAAICRYHGVSELWSADRDFTRFPELAVRNPLL